MNYHKPKPFNHLTTMTLQEYIEQYEAAQEAWLKENGLGIDSTVRIVRPFQEVPEYGAAWTPEKSAVIGKEGVIKHIYNDCISIVFPEGLVEGNMLDFPYTSLEPVSKERPELNRKINENVEDSTAQQIYNRIDNDKAVELLGILLGELQDEQIEYCFFGLCRQRRIELLVKLNSDSKNLDKLPQP